jgi:hypothetical protein
MRRISFDLSGKIDPLTVAALSALKSVADYCDSPFFMIGASARDFILKHCYGIEPRRLTTDIDLGVQVADWAHFHKLTGALMATGKFLPDPSQKQRYHYGSVLIDLVPFGPIAKSDRQSLEPIGFRSIRPKQHRECAAGQNHLDRGNRCSANADKDQQFQIFHQGNHRTAGSAQSRLVEKAP